jgi:hypothetical protein
MGSGFGSAIVHAKAVHHALDEGLAMERRLEGFVHPVVWATPYERRPPRRPANGSA